MGREVKDPFFYLGLSFTTIAVVCQGKGGETPQVHDDHQYERGRVEKYEIIISKNTVNEEEIDENECQTHLH